MVEVGDLAPNFNLVSLKTNQSRCEIIAADHCC
jgi:hypothetical protein